MHTADTDRWSNVGGNLVARHVPADTWSDGDAYEAYIGRWSRLVARDFLRWLDASADLRWLDSGAGTGALTMTIVDTVEPRQVVGVEPANGYVAMARRRVVDHACGSNVGSVLAAPRHRIRCRGVRPGPELSSLTLGLPCGA